MSDIAIQLSKVNKSFGENHVLKDVCLTVPSGKITGLLGRNGCGKSVLLKCVLGLLPADSGEITVCGEKLRGEPPRTPIGFIVNSPGLLPGASACRNMEIIARIRNIVHRPQIEQTLALVGLDPKAKKAVKYYSMGMRQRLAIAIALMEDPPILLLDEPLNGLDQAGAREMRELLLRQAKMNKTILFTSHSQADIEALCDRRYTIVDGSVTQNDSGGENEETGEENGADD